MAVDAMDLDTSPTAPTDVERKRKSKTKDASSPTKKRKQTEVNGDKTSRSKNDKSSTKTAPVTTAENADSPFSLVTATMYLPLSPISISSLHAQSSMLAEHLSPLLLTYYPPLKGIILAYSQASISSRPPTSPARDSTNPNPKPLTMAKSADEYGVLYVYLTATFLVFRPQRGQTLEGWVNVQSEGFLGAVVFNLFSVGIESKRLPADWRWVPPGEEGEADADTDAAATTDNDEPGAGSVPPGFDAAKEHFQPAALAADELDIEGGEEEDESSSGHFQSVSGHRVRGNVRFRVVDIDVIPGSERDRGFLSIEGTMLDADAEEKLLQAEQQGQALPPSFHASPRKSNRVVPISTGPELVSVVEIDAPANGDVDEAELEEPVKKEKKEKKEKKAKSSSSSKSKKDKKKNEK
ncbi:hypothetical protein N7462_000202 [Penicillium macrosclerotiorum]|uniref:uncharacterized protein n=1 Tax=Penicillium macrosclerotiorum TaxID=303699 RepID=UPI002549025A|nr:uncharacterized protein N7462_000202 [Penicillium macrosclerotiorum]KAJ5698197.1 hypothetical protein N7462_000202 [Penicillium macrosclerotiorum]